AVADAADGGAAAWALARVAAGNRAHFRTRRYRNSATRKAIRAARTSGTSIFDHPSNKSCRVLCEVLSGCRVKFRVILSKAVSLTAILFVCQATVFLELRYLRTHPPSLAD